MPAGSGVTLMVKGIVRRGPCAEYLRGSREEKNRIEGNVCVVVSKFDGQLVIKLPVGLTSGLKDLKILYGSGASVTHQSVF